MTFIEENLYKIENYDEKTGRLRWSTICTYNGTGQDILSNATDAEEVHMFLEHAIKWEEDHQADGWKYIENTYQPRLAFAEDQDFIVEHLGTRDEHPEYWL